MSNVISLEARRSQVAGRSAAESKESEFRDEPVMLLFDTPEGIEQRLAFYLFEDQESVTVSAALPASAESMQNVPFLQLAGMVFVSARAGRLQR